MPKSYSFLILFSVLMTSALVGCMAETAWSADTDVDDEKLKFFESKIRPVLVQHCYRCHGAQAVSKGQLKGGLRVDSREGLLMGGDSGPAVVPGKPEDSLLLDALRYNLFEMPPEGKLADTIVADFDKWVSAGAVDPRDDATPSQAPSKIDIEAARTHWAYRPIPEQIELPEPMGHTSIDTLIEHRLIQSGLKANEPADRRTLVRRLYFDLHGLPPTPEEAALFLNDSSPMAYDRLVDRLLASQEFGRHWGRHWLDIVRFAESVTLRGLVQQQAWRYRNYVIDAWNSDLPYDQFLREQIAGDLMSADSVSESQRMHIATTFLTLTNANLEDQDKEKLRMDVVDEQLDVIGKAFLAQTIGCARCHDHKFDPIPTRDYYAMAGILQNARTLETANVSRWLDLPLPLEKEEAVAFARIESERTQLQQKISALKKQTTSSRKIVNRNDLPGIVIDDEMAIFQGNWTRSTSVSTYVDSGYQHDDDEAKGEKSATFPVDVPESGDYEVRLSYAPSSNRSTRVDVSIWNVDGETVVRVNQQQSPAIDGLFVSLGTFPFQAEMPAKVVISNKNSNAHVIVDCIQLLKVSKTPNESLAKDPKAKPDDETSQKQLTVQIRKLENALKQLDKSLPPREMYMGVVPQENITDLPIHIRGNVHQHGPVVPRGFLQIVSYKTPPVIHEDECGRLQLAEWISDASNPLPARVIANRTWHWLFGAGLVRTTDNFGFSGESPSHPVLIDYLARSLINKHWSLKSLIKEIVMTEAYRRSSHIENDAMATDPDNRLLWRMNRKRLSAECIQDSILMTAGILDRTQGESALPANLTADYGFEYESRRRAIYWPLLRNSIPELIATFDGANPSLVVGNRTVSSVATQALFMMNNPWVMKQSERAAQELLSQEMSDPETLQLAFQRILGREPTPGERQAALDFLKNPQNENHSARLSSWTRLVQSLFSTIDFRYCY